MPNVTMTNTVIAIHLASWRYFALLTLPPLALAFNLLYTLDCIALLILFLLTHYYCWRLWLDERLFLLLNGETDLAEFDAAMACIGKKSPASARPYEARWRGARRYFYRTIVSLSLLWLVALCSVLYQSLTIVE